MRARRGIALPAVLLVLVALGVLSSLALADAVVAWRAANFAEDAVRARAAALSGASRLISPPDLAWLCLQPPSRPLRRIVDPVSGADVRLAWWFLGNGVVRGEVEARGPQGARYRLLVSLRVDSLPADSVALGCPSATRLAPAGGTWFRPTPEG